MAGINKKTWKTKHGIKSYYEITYYENGKQKHKGGFKTKIEAQIALREIITEKNTDILFEALANEYITRHCQLNCKYSTICLYNSYLDIYLGDIKKLKAKDISKRNIENLILLLKTKGLSNKTINSVITFVQSILNYGVEIEQLSKNPIEHIKKLPIVKPTIHFLNEEQIQVFLQQAKEKTPTYYAFFYTAVHTGMRRGELLALEWSDIDFRRERIRVNKQIYRGITQTTKTSKERYIDMSKGLIDVLKTQKLENTLLCKYVFHKNGLPLKPNNMEEHYFRPLIKLCNTVLDVENQIEKFKFHDLRHTYATYLLSRGIPVKYVQEQLGHSTARMTLDTYASFMPSVKFDALDLLDNIDNKNRRKIAEKTKS